MNIFILDNDIEKCAQAHVDKHVIKMPLEHAQMLCTAYRMAEGKAQKLHYLTAKGTVSVRQKNIYVIDSDVIEDGVLTQREVYLNAYENHPCSKWVRESIDNFLWLLVLTDQLNAEYRYRYKKDTNLKAFDVVKNMVETKLPDLPHVGRTPFAQAMPEDYQCEDAVEAYRTYYQCDKSHLADWKNREKPKWWI